MVHLVDHQDVVFDECMKRGRYSADLIRIAIRSLIHDELRYNPKNGRTYCKSYSGWCCEYVDNPPTYTDDSNCAQWEFSNLVSNEASKTKRNIIN